VLFAKKHKFLLTKDEFVSGLRSTGVEACAHVRGQEQKLLRLHQELSQVCTVVPDGMFAYQKSQFWFTLESLGIDLLFILNGELAYFVTILLLFGILHGHLVYFSRFGLLHQKNQIATRIEPQQT
jgi:hypothetical protein